MRQKSPRAADVVAWAIAGIGLFLVLVLHLLPSLLAGLLVYELVDILAPQLRVVRIQRQQGKLVAVAILAVGVVLLLGGTVIGIIAFVRSEAGSLPALLQKMADIIDSWRTMLPPSVVEQLPADVDELKSDAVTMLRGHAGTLQHLGTEAGRVLAHVLVGMGIGAMAALHEVRSTEPLGPLAEALQERASRLGTAFRQVVFGQLRISALNTLLTGLYLIVGLRLMGVHLPLAKTMIALTFIVGLLPVIGNIISNTVIVVLSLSVSPTVAIMSLVFLVVIHKFEYFLNAHIVGSRVRSHAWELLLAMLVMESAFGIAGLIAAPIYYAYIKAELVNQGMV